MNVLLISQCDKRALSETRRILDQFAERRGERTWQTPITEAGLDTLRRLLRATARKNTAVACHWIRGLDHSELLWVVGDKRRFNAQGAVPTNTTRRDVLRSGDENDWHSGEDIHLLAALAALLHDLGKACQAFQDRLAGRGQLGERNRYRHEWVSLRLFQAFVGTDDDTTWLARLADPTPADLARWSDWQTGHLRRDGLDDPARCPPPFAALAHAPLAQAVGWLIVTHHRLPVLPAFFNNEPQTQKRVGARSNDFNPARLLQGVQAMQANWNEVVENSAPRAEIEPYWQFPQGLPVTLPHWQAQARRLALRLGRLAGRADRQPGSGFVWLAEPYVMHLSRLALMLADHHYSSLTVLADGRTPQPGRLSVPAGCTLLANTCKVHGRTRPNQTLDEHLLGVAAGSRLITHALPSLARSLPGLLNHKPLRRPSADARFRWQDKATERAAGLRAQAHVHGAFIVNMASTGTGKTLANARVMNALADPAQGLRCAFAMGLRTLTLQTGRAFQQLLNLGEDELAIRVGGSAGRVLFEHFEARAEAAGSGSTQALLLEEDEEGSVEFGGDAGLDERHPLLARALHDPQVKKLLVAPLLVCTIDHLTPATESLRGGRQIAPMLRLLSGDLVLDEPDDFDLADLPALTRLVHWAGLLGSRVLLSSATLAPALVQGLFEAYRAGRIAYQRHRGTRPGGVPEIACLWVDEFEQHAAACASAPVFMQQHTRFVQQRHARLTAEAQQAPRRRCALIDTAALAALRSEAERHDALAALLQRHALKLHEQHAQPDPRQPARRVSFGLVRMANIEPLVAVARAWLRQGPQREGVQVHLCVYHAQFPLLLRSGIEQRLDAALNRRQPEAVFALPDIRARLDAYPQAQDQLFIVLGSPVTEVGRDHDYDWAIVEPSSMRSLIQLAGRVRRHRGGACDAQRPNVRVLNTNLRHLNHPGELAYCRPGFETAQEWRLAHHGLNELLPLHEREVLDARPRISCPPTLAPQQRWVDLEHARLRQVMLPASALGAEAQAPVATAAVSARQARAGRVGAAAQAGATAQPNAASWWEAPAVAALTTAVLPQHQPFREETREHVELCLRPSDDDPERIELTEVVDSRGRGNSTRYLSAEARRGTWPDAGVCGPGICAWAAPDYAQALAELAEAMGLSVQRCAERFGTVSVPQSEQGWWWDPVLGLVVRR